MNAYNLAYTPKSKFAAFYHRDMYYSLVYKLNRTQPPKVLKERFMVDVKSFTFTAYNFWLDIFDRKLQQYIEADLINCNNRYWKEHSNPKRFEVYKEPFAVLTLDELEAGFVVYMVSLALSILVFCFEWMQNLKDLTIFLFIFKNYFELKESEQKRHSDLMKIKIAIWRSKEKRKVKILPV